MSPRTVALSVASALAFSACGDMAKLPVQAGMGKNPELPPPTKTLLPTVHIATATGWPANTQPTAAEGTQVVAFAAGLDHPRWVYVLPNGDVLVAETNAPPKPDANPGIKGWFMKMMMKRAGAGTPSANRITLLRDADGDGVAEMRTAFIEGLNSPFGMALVGNDFYVANTDAVVRFPYSGGETRITAAPTQASSICPPGRSIITGPRTSSRAGRNAASMRRSARTATSPRTAWRTRKVARRSGKSTWRRGSPRLFATGLRNPNGMAWEPRSRHAVDGRQRARRARQRPRSRLPDVGERRRLLRLAVQLLRPARRRAREAAAPRPGRASAIAPDYALGAAHRVARAGVSRRQRAAAAVRERHVHRPARLVEPQAAQRLQGRLRAVRRRQAVGRCRSTCSPDSSATNGDALRTAGRRRDRQDAARCWSPTTSAT